ncbi:hypothetical protein L916_12832 [Phytophthora nicotianae]|uniref:Uncharacterized protein n=1 Tax=Phytophthora nicotianae TaxID=4792 RepID=W2ILI4_PHYNI|nr:hypothetical protein L916_12832 [Phytophthora nicotianae]
MLTNKNRPQSSLGKATSEVNGYQKRVGLEYDKVSKKMQQMMESSDNLHVYNSA